MAGPALKVAEQAADEGVASLFNIVLVLNLSATTTTGDHHMPITSHTGLIISRGRRAATGTITTVTQQGTTFDVTCEAHGQIQTGITSKGDALQAARYPRFCTECNVGGEQTHAPAPRTRTTFSPGQQREAFVIAFECFAIDADDLVGQVDGINDKPTARKLLNKLERAGHLVSDVINEDGRVWQSAHGTYDDKTLEEALAESGL